MKDLILVYGTLKTGNRNENYMRTSRLIGKAETVEWNFALFELDSLRSGMNYAFPGVVELPGLTVNKPIVGELYEVNRETLRVMDIHEGTDPARPFRKKNVGYYRRRVWVKVMTGPEKGTVRGAWIYLMTIQRARRGRLYYGKEWIEPEGNGKTFPALPDDPDFYEDEGVIGFDESPPGNVYYLPVKYRIAATTRKKGRGQR